MCGKTYGVKIMLILIPQECLQLSVMGRLELIICQEWSGCFIVNIIIYITMTDISITILEFKRLKRAQRKEAD